MRDSFHRSLLTVHLNLACIYRSCGNSLCFSHPCISAFIPGSSPSVVGALLCVLGVSAVIGLWFLRSKKSQNQTKSDHFIPFILWAACLIALHFVKRADTPFDYSERCESQRSLIILLNRHVINLNHRCARWHASCQSNR